MERKRIIKLLIIELVFVILVLALDQITKFLIFEPINNGAPDMIIIQGVLRFTAVKNTGASFGMFQGKVEILGIVSILATVGLSIFAIVTAKNRNGWFRSALVLIIAGGIGNAIDRVCFKYVRDFVYVELTDFAVFNFADSALSFGTALLIIYIIFFYKGPTNVKKDEIKALKSENISTETPNTENVITETPVDTKPITKDGKK